MSSTVKKRKTTKKPWLKKNTKTPESTPNPSLPDDLLLSCFARASRLYYPTLSLVSKSFASLLAAPHLYQTRSSLGRTESCLYVCLRFPNETNPRWFTLCQKPDRTRTTNYTMQLRKKSSGYVLATVPIPHSPPNNVHKTGLVAVGSNIYNIGVSKAPSSSVSILDCTSHTWRQAPSMLIERYCSAAGVVDGKIYVKGGCEDCNCTGCCCDSCMEILDPKTQTWELVSRSYGLVVRDCRFHRRAVINGKLYMVGNHGGLAYTVREGLCERLGRLFRLGWPSSSYSMINNMLYTYNGLFRWHDTEAGVWGDMKGLKGLPKFASSGCVKLADYGGKMAVLWDKYLPCSEYKKKTIWCAVIALKRCSIHEIWGKVEWHDAVLTVPDSYEFVCALATTV